MRVAQTLASILGLKGVCDDVLLMASARISCFARLMFEASDVESVEALQTFDS